MKKQVLGSLIVITLLLSGCSSKSTSSTATDAKNANVSNIVAESKNNSNITGAGTKEGNNSTGAITVKTSFPPLKPGTVPQLSSQQKQQINSKLNTALKNMDDTLKSIQDPSDVNLNSVN